MITLLQLINRMIHLEYTKAEIEEMFRLVSERHIAPETLFAVLNFEVPYKAKVDRMVAALPKVDSAIAISFMKEGIEA